MDAADAMAEVMRLSMLHEINNGPETREELQKLYGDVYDTQELQEQFEVIGFLAPLVVVRRKSDGVRGSLKFRHIPRFYFEFAEG